jgi:hypothetical protein
MAKTIPGRAQTVAQKSTMLDALFKSWVKCPDMRFGQLLVNAMRSKDDNLMPLFYIEDDKLELAVVEFLLKNEKA